jgi:hypothetical protein
LSDERTFDEDEVSEIFALAANTEEPGLPVRTERRGMTLAELQEVGREVGLSPERVAAAAARLETRVATPPRAMAFGTPTAVGRVVDLPRSPTDREWGVLVSELRQTFGARGRETSRGELREWTNGNLHAFVEPMAGGVRLRLGTRKTGSKEIFGFGMVWLVAGLFLLVTAGLDAVTFGTTMATLIPALMTLAGGGLVGWNALRLRGWASERERQLEHVAGRAVALLETPASPEDEAS